MYLCISIYWDDVFRVVCCFFFFQAEDGIRDAQESRGLGDVYKRTPVCCNLEAREQSHLWPDGAQGNQENAVHHTLQMCRQTHTQIMELRLDQAREETEQEQEHPMPE